MAVSWGLFLHTVQIVTAKIIICLAMAVVQKPAVFTAHQSRYLPKSSVTTSQDSSVVGEVLWLVQFMRAGVKSEQISLMVPFDLSPD